MEIALCLSGQARCFDKVYEYVKRNLLDKHDVTVFCHVWDFPEVEKLKELYKPQNIIVEASIKPDLSKYTRVPPPQPNWKVKDPALSTYAQFYSLNVANKLKMQYEKENKMTFDWVIRSRYDFALNVEIPFETLDNTKLYIPNCRRTSGRDFGNDQFAFSSS